MMYKGVVKGNVIQLEDEVILPEGTQVSVIPEKPVSGRVLEYPMTLKAWLREARQVRDQLPQTSDSAEILRRLREDRASR